MMSMLDVQEMLGLALLGMISEDTEVIISTNRGYPLVLNRPPTLAGLAFEQAAWRLVEQDNMQAVMVEEEPKKRGFFLLFRKVGSALISKLASIVLLVLAKGFNVSNVQNAGSCSMGDWS
ncbi:hypothetical protein ACFX1S_018855 [Malus domestica]